MRNWFVWLREWNVELLAHIDQEQIQEQEIDLRRAVVQTGWMGYPGAREQVMRATEKRLGTRLPPSYRTFLETSNGWWMPTLPVPRLLACSEIGWFRDVWKRMELWNYWAPPQRRITDERYFTYGAAQNTAEFRAEYVPNCLVISAREGAGTAVFLLNPMVIGTDGEWEAWLMARWLPGARRYPSFWDLMQETRRNMLLS